MFIKRNITEKVCVSIIAMRAKYHNMFLQKISYGVLSSVFNITLMQTPFLPTKTGNCPSRINREVASTTFAKLNATHFFLPFFFLGTAVPRVQTGQSREVVGLLYHPKKEHHMQIKKELAF